MSLVGHNILYEIIKVHGITDPAIILEELDKKLDYRLNEAGQNINDGMDIAVVTIDNQMKTIKFSGAKNHLYFVKKKGEDHLFKGSKRSIRDKMRKKIRFESISLPYESGDWIYLYTDGYPDQFGEKSGNKYLSKELRNLLRNNSIKPVNQQYDILAKEFMDWKGIEEQLDDVTVVGIGF